MASMVGKRRGLEFGVGFELMLFVVSEVAITRVFLIFPNHMLYLHMICWYYMIGFDGAYAILCDFLGCTIYGQPLVGSRCHPMVITQPLDVSPRET